MSVTQNFIPVGPTVWAQLPGCCGVATAKPTRGFRISVSETNLKT